MVCHIDSSWEPFFNSSLQSGEYDDLIDFVKSERSVYQVFPPEELVFNAFKLTPLSEVKVVILGQDPYHNDFQAHGLSFSVPKGIPPPPSLKNVFTELHQDIPLLQAIGHGDLSKWANRGVLLLNSILTVRAHQAGSHQKKGWERFTDHVIKEISKTRDHVVFMFWGNYAIKKSVLVDTNKHLVLTAVHPSPLSVYRGFYGCKHFSKANKFLALHGIPEVDWQI